jgi:L-amino acid N-acyltransferase YncA
MAIAAWLDGAMRGEQVRSGQGSVVIRPMASGDAGQVLAIYQAGLDGGQASFETRAPKWEEFSAARLPGHRHVAADAATGQVLGPVAASATSSRRVYAGVIEHSVYVDPAHHGHGIGSGLLAALIASTEAAGIWTIQSGVFPENGASLRLHQRAGFRVVGPATAAGPSARRATIARRVPSASAPHLSASRLASTNR